MLESTHRGHMTRRRSGLIASLGITALALTGTAGLTGSASAATAPAGLSGFAAVAGTTTGGAGGATVTVTNLAQLQSEAGKTATETILVKGLFTGKGNVKVTSNKSIIGVGASSGLTGIGLSVVGQRNVIIRNLNISKVTSASGTGDSIHVEKSNHLWIDHNNLFSDMSHGKDYYDGQIDLTHATDYVTVSWNKMHDHYKLSLDGHSDSNAAEDTGKLHVTYHHNYFYNFNSRTPSLRFGTGHVYDNYFVNGSTGVHSREGAQMLVQNNIFRKVSTPIQTHASSLVDGYVNLSGNDLGGATINVRTGNFTKPPYAFKLDETAIVINLVTSGAGTGKI